MADVNRVPRLTADVVLEDLGDDVLAFDGETLTHLAGAASTVARAVDGLRSAADLGRALGTDVTEALDLLLEHGLVEMVEPPGGQHFRRSDHVGFCSDGERVVIVDLLTGDRHVLEGGGPTIWGLVTSGSSLSGAIDTLEHEYPGTGLASEAAQLVNLLVGLGLLEESGNSPSIPRPKSGDSTRPNGYPPLA